MNLQQKARSLSLGINNPRESITQHPTAKKHEQLGEETEKSQEIMNIIFAEHIATLVEATKEIYRGIYSFSAVTDRIETEKREIYKLTEEVRNQKLDTGKLFYELEEITRGFPAMVTDSIESSVGATSNHLNNSINRLASEISQAVEKTFKRQIDSLNQTAARSTSSAKELLEAKKFIGWQSIIINCTIVMIAAALLIVYITPRIPEYRANEEEQRQIITGKNFEAIWPKLSKDAKQEINAVYSRHVEGER